MKTTVTIGLICLAASVVACDKKSTPTPSAAASGSSPAASQIASATAAPAPSAPLTAVASAAPAPSDATYMAHCPTASKDAKVAMKDVPEGIELAITGPAEADIRSRAKQLVEASKNGGASGAHNGGGGGHGSSGHCTVLIRNTDLDVSDIPGGSRITVKAKSKDEVAWVRRETRERDANAHQPGGEDLGRKHLAHCPSAVDGAQTKVAEIKEGVTITVTSNKDDAVKQIRERAQHQAEIAKLPEEAKVEHNGAGGGGGALGRCPIVLQGATLVETKDVTGGTQVTVKAKTAKDVVALQKESKDRAAFFTNRTAAK